MLFSLTFEYTWYYDLFSCFYHSLVRIKAFVVSVLLIKNWCIIFCDRHPLVLDNAAVLLRFLNFTTKNKSKRRTKFSRERTKGNVKTICVFNNDRIIRNFLCTFNLFGRIIYIISNWNMIFDLEWIQNSYSWKSYCFISFPVNIVS